MPCGFCLFCFSNLSFGLCPFTDDLTWFTLGLLLTDVHHLLDFCCGVDYCLLFIFIFPSLVSGASCAGHDVFFVLPAMCLRKSVLSHALMLEIIFSLNLFKLLPQQCLNYS